MVSGKRRSRLLISAGLIALLLGLILLTFRHRVLVALGGSMAVSDPLEHADLIYVLAGDFWGSRVLLGAKLGAQGWAPQVILSGGRYMDRWASDMAVDFAVQHGYPRSLFSPHSHRGEVHHRRSARHAADFPSAGREANHPGHQQFSFAPGSIGLSPLPS